MEGDVLQRLLCAGTALALGVCSLHCHGFHTLWHVRDLGKESKLVRHKKKMANLKEKVQYFLSQRFLKLLGEQWHKLGTE